MQSPRKAVQYEGKKGRMAYEPTDDERVTVEALQEQLASASKELSEYQEQAKELSQQLATSVPRSQALQMRRELEAKIEDLTSENQELMESLEGERREREWLETELGAQYKAASFTDQEMKNLQEFVKKLHALLEDKGKVVESQKEEREGILRQLEEAKEEATRLKKEAALKARSLARLEETHRDAIALSKGKDEKLASYQKEAALARRHYDQLHKELRRQNEKRAEVETQLKNIRGKVKVATEQVKIRGRQERLAKRQIDRIRREKEGLQRNLVKITAEEKKQTSLVNLGEKERQKSQSLILKSVADLHQQDKLITQLQDAKDRQVEETAEVEAKFVALAGEVESRDKELEDLTRRQMVLRTKLETTSAILDALQRENYAINRKLSLLKVEKDEVEEVVKKKSYITSKLTDICNSKEQKLLSLTADLDSSKWSERRLRGRVEELKAEIASQSLSLKFVEGEKFDLQRILEGHEVKLEDLKRILDEEQDNRGTELTTLCRRNDEVVALRSRVGLLEHVLTKGNQAYEARLVEIRALKNELAGIKDERDTLFRQVTLIKSLKEELARQQKLLVATQKEKGVLERDAINKKVVLHRWTSLQASDPDSYELLKKTHNLQKRFLIATERIVTLENEVRQKDKEVEALRRLLERTSACYEGGPGGGGHVVRMTLQNQLRSRDEQLKHVTAALNSSVLKQEDADQEKKELKTKIEALTLKVTQLQRKLQRASNK